MQPRPLENRIRQSLAVASEIDRELALVRQFELAIATQNQSDSELAAAFVRILSKPRGSTRPHVDKLKKLIREIVREESRGRRCRA